MAATTSESSLTRQKHLANRQLVGLCIYIICCGGTSGQSAFFVYMAEKYGCTVTQAVLGTSITNIVSFVCAQFVGGFIQRWGARRSMVVSLVGALVGFLIMAVAPNIYVAWVGFAVCGLTYSFGLTVPVATMVRSWWCERQGTVLGTVLGLAGVGTALWPMLAGIMLEALGLTPMLLFYTPLFVVPGLLDVAFVLRDTPEECGVKPVGWSEELEEQRAVASATMASANGEQKADVYRMPLFWVCCVILVVQVITQSAASLLTTALQTAGMAVGVASTVAGVASIVAIFGNMIAGWLRDKVGYVGFIVFSFGTFVLSSACLLAWMLVAPGSVSSVYIWLSMVLQGLSRATLYMPAHMAGLLFPDCTDVAQARMQSFVSLGGVVILPMVSAFAESSGSYVSVAYLWILAGAACGIAWIVLVLRHDWKEKRAAKS